MCMCETDREREKKRERESCVIKYRNFTARVNIHKVEHKPATETSL